MSRTLKNIKHAELKCYRGVDDEIIDLWVNSQNTRITRRLLIAYAEHARKNDTINHKDVYDVAMNNVRSSTEVVRISLNIPVGEFRELCALWESIGEGLKSDLFKAMIKKSIIDTSTKGAELSLSSFVATNPGIQWSPGAPSIDGYSVESVPEEEIQGLPNDEPFQEEAAVMADSSMISMMQGFEILE